MGVGPQEEEARWLELVLIPYSSGMGVGPSFLFGDRGYAVLIPYSSGMGVGPKKATVPVYLRQS